MNFRKDVGQNKLIAQKIKVNNSLKIFQRINFK